MAARDAGGHRLYLYDLTYIFFILLYVRERLGLHAISIFHQCTSHFTITFHAQTCRRNGRVSLSTWWRESGLKLKTGEAATGSGITTSLQPYPRAGPRQLKPAWVYFGWQL